VSARAMHRCALLPTAALLALSASFASGCKGPNSPSADLPACDAADVQVGAQEVAAETLKIPFSLSSFREVEAESVARKRTCRVRATHKGSGASIYMKFTVERVSPKELTIVFAPIE